MEKHNLDYDVSHVNFTQLQLILNELTPALELNVFVTNKIYCQILLE